MDLLPGYVAVEAVSCLFAVLFVLFALDGFPLKGAIKPRLERSASMDFLKGVAIVAVVAIHATTFAAWGAPLKNYFDFAIPFFIICSGYLLSRRHPEGVELKGYFTGIFWRIAVPYAIYTFAAWLVLGAGSLDLGALLADLALGRANYGALYFVPLILQFYVLYPFIARHRKLLLSNAALLAVLLASIWISNMDYQLRAQQWNSNAISMIFFGRFAFYFLFGMRLSQADEAKLASKKSLPMLAALAACSLVLPLYDGSRYFGYASPLLGFIAGIWLAAMLQRSAYGLRVFGAFAKLGRHTLGIYLLHTPAISLLGMALPSLWGGAIGFAALTAAATLLSYAAALFFLRLSRQVPVFSRTTTTNK